MNLVNGTRVFIAYHTPQHLHRLRSEDWNQLREAGFPVERVWEQGMPSVDPADEELQFSSSLINVRQQSQASEVETQEETLQSLQVDHNLLLRPTLQAMCWLVDAVLSMDAALQLETVSKPKFNVQAIDHMIQEMQTQLHELTEQRHQLEMSMVTICLSQMLIAMVKLTAQLGIHFHLGVVLTHCLMTGLWNKDLFKPSRISEIVNVVLMIPTKTIWAWIPNVFSFTCLDVSTEEN